MTEAKRPSFAVRVECYAGYRGEETPRRFCFGENCIEVAAVIDRWLAPDHRYFKLLGDDGGLYILRHDTITLCWELTWYAQKMETESDQHHNLKGPGHVQ
jgi:hypothetical protein